MTGNGLQPLTEKQVERLKSTFKLIDPDKLAMRFYSSLFARYPQVKHLFPTDLTELSTKIVSVFALVVYSFQERAKGEFYLQEEVLRPLRTLGKLHADKGVEAMHYGLVNEVLLESIHDQVPGQFSNEVEVAWKLALNHLTSAMLSEGESDGVPTTTRDAYEKIKDILFKT